MLLIIIVKSWKNVIYFLRIYIINEFFIFIFVNYCACTWQMKSPIIFSIENNLKIQVIIVQILKIFGSNRLFPFSITSISKSSNVIIN